MGIKLDWEIEAEQSHVKTAGEDPVTARHRRRARLRVILVILLVPLALVIAVGVVIYRLRMIDVEIEGALRNTADAEVAALRLGDWTAFALTQRSASDDWLRLQERAFSEYQTLKQQDKIQLTGQILDAAVDKTRGRVKVQEIIEGIPYTRVWFYWRYDDGWRHVPPDYTFWGEVKQYQGQGVTVRYQSVDEPFATSVGASLDIWLKTACVALVCNNLSNLQVEVLPDDGLQASWSNNNPWLLQLPSPYLRRARSDMPFDTGAQLAAANLVAERLVAQTSNNLKPIYPTDAYYLRQAIVAWLVGQFVQFDTNAYVINSLTQNYGAPAVGRLLQALRADSNLSILNDVTGAQALAAAKLDWRDFLTWRLVTEADLIKRGDDTGFLSLYDTRDANARNLAAGRFRVLPTGDPITVVSAQVETEADGAPIIRALAEVGSKGNTSQHEVVFRLADGVWKRAN